MAGSFNGAPCELAQVGFGVQSRSGTKQVFGKRYRLNCEERLGCGNALAGEHRAIPRKLKIGDQERNG